MAINMQAALRSRREARRGEAEETRSRGYVLGRSVHRADELVPWSGAGAVAGAGAREEPPDGQARNLVSPSPPPLSPLLGPVLRPMPDARCPCTMGGGWCLQRYTTRVCVCVLNTANLRSVHGRSCAARDNDKSLWQWFDG